MGQQISNSGVRPPSKTPRASEVSSTASSQCTVGEAPRRRVVQQMQKVMSGPAGNLISEYMNVHTNPGHGGDLAGWRAHATAPDRSAAPAESKQGPAPVDVIWDNDPDVQLTLQPGNPIWLKHRKTGVVIEGAIGLKSVSGSHYFALRTFALDPQGQAAKDFSRYEKGIIDSDTGIYSSGTCKDYLVGAVDTRRMSAHPLDSEPSLETALQEHRGVLSDNHQDWPLMLSRLPDGVIADGFAELPTGRPAVRSSREDGKQTRDQWQGLTLNQMDEEMLFDLCLNPLDNEDRRTLPGKWPEAAFGDILWINGCRTVCVSSPATNRGNPADRITVFVPEDGGKDRNPKAPQQHRITQADYGLREFARGRSSESVSSAVPGKWLTSTSLRNELGGRTGKFYTLTIPKDGDKGSKPSLLAEPVLRQPTSRFHTVEPTPRPAPMAPGQGVHQVLQPEQAAVAKKLVPQMPMRLISQVGDKVLCAGAEDRKFLYQKMGEDRDTGETVYLFPRSHFEKDTRASTDVETRPRGKHQDKRQTIDMPPTSPLFGRRVVTDGLPTGVTLTATHTSIAGTDELVCRASAEIPGLAYHRVEGMGDGHLYAFARDALRLAPGVSTRRPQQKDWTPETLPIHEWSVRGPSSGSSSSNRSSQTLSANGASESDSEAST